MYEWPAVRRNLESGVGITLGLDSGEQDGSFTFLLVSLCPWDGRIEDAVLEIKLRAKDIILSLRGFSGILSRFFANCLLLR